MGYAAALAWLLEPANDWVTGQVLGVDGGLADLKVVTGELKVRVTKCYGTGQETESDLEIRYRGYEPFATAGFGKTLDRCEIAFVSFGPQGSSSWGPTR